VYPSPYSGRCVLLSCLDVEHHGLAGATHLLVVLPVCALALLFAENVSKVPFPAIIGKTNLVAEPGRAIASATTKQWACEVGVHLSTCEAAGTDKAAGGAGLVVVERCEELSFSGAAESVVAERPHIPLSRRDGRDYLTEMLHVLLPDLGTTTHHHSGEDDDEVQSTLFEQRTATGVLCLAVLVEELVTKAGVKLLADSSRTNVGMLLIRVARGEEVDPGELLGRGFAGNLESNIGGHVLVLVAFEHA
jgi:hypothetical protein